MPGLLAAIALLLAHFVWYQDKLVSLLPVLGNSALIATELSLLILGAYSFYMLLDGGGHFQHLDENLQKQYAPATLLLLLVWFLCCFFEGIAGFGIPALLIAPLLINTGYKPTSAIVLTLSANTLSVCYGALGTPLKLGLGLTQPGNPIIQYINLLVLPLLLLLPVWLLVLGGRLEPRRALWSTRNAGLGLLAGLLFFIPMYAASFLSLEFPSVLGGAFGFVAFLTITNPKGQLKESLAFWFRFFRPYLALLAVLMCLRMVIGFAAIDIHPMLRKIAFYQPGLIILLFTFIWTLTSGTKAQAPAFLCVMKASWQKVSFSLLVIACLVLFANLLKQPIQAFLTNLQAEKHWLPALGAFSGVLGSFVSGSLTMSNLMLADAFAATIKDEAFLPGLLAILHIGGALGNAISLQNILVVNAVMPVPCSIRKVAGLNSITVGLALVVLVILGYIIP